MALERLKRWRSFGGWQEVWRHPSDATATPMEFAVYLPPAAEREPCPVVYYLSGLTCTWANATEKAGAQRVASRLGLVLVFPDTSPRGTDLPGEHEAYDLGSGAGFYVDATQAPWSAHYRMYSYVTRELPALVETSFPVDRARKSIMGHSMGGHGALVAALREPDRWRSVSAIAPIVAPIRVPWGQKALSAYLGPDRDAWQAWDATALISGTDWQRPILVDQGLADEFLQTQLRPEFFEATCRDIGVPLTLRRHAEYDHSYYFISTVMEDHLSHHAEALAGD